MAQMDIFIASATLGVGMGKALIAWDPHDSGPDPDAPNHGAVYRTHRLSSSFINLPYESRIFVKSCCLGY